ncbi:MAG TPA: TRAP transporter large permease [Dehalococcoidia bacterium]|nr:TRAP transporter large permease [Dehalococcoidia bacterium]
MIDPLLGAAIATVLFLALLAIGAPIFVSLTMGGIVGIFLAEGSRGLLAISTVAFGHAYSFGVLAITLFVFMGNLLVHHDIGKEVYGVVYKWVGQIRGGLAIVSTLFGALFGFMCGSSLAGVATVGGVSLPEMEERGYDRRISAGTLALAGSLAALIPPSVLMILYTIITQASLGRLFIAGIIPGFALVILMVAYIFIRVTINPKLAPAGPSFTWGEKGKSLVHLIPVAVIFLSVIGGLYMGIWSPTEAGATGAVAALLVCLAYRRVTWGKVKTASLRTVQTFVMIYMLLIGASLLAHLYFISGINAAIQSSVANLMVPTWLIIILMWFVMMILGMFLDAPAMVLIAVPVFLPIIEALGFDIIWFGVVIVLGAEMAGITPPVGLALFIIQSIAPKGTTLMDCIIGAAPYVGILWILLGLLIAFPEIAMWLPSMMRGY